MGSKKGLYKDFFLNSDILVIFFLFIVATVTVLCNELNFARLLSALLGILVFAISEYTTHRFLFHLKAPNNPFFLKLLKRLHYDHHKYPNDLKLLFLPIWYSLPNFVVLLAIFYKVNHVFLNTISFGIGLSGMLLIYEWKHFIAHRPIKPRTTFGKWVKKVHLLHHYKNENFWFGVSTPFADYLFGTLRNEKDVDISPTAKDLQEEINGF